MLRKICRTFVGLSLSALLSADVYAAGRDIPPLSESAPTAVVTDLPEHDLALSTADPAVDSTATSSEPQPDVVAPMAPAADDQPPPAASKPKKKKAPDPYKLFNFDNDFRYLEDPNNTYHFWGDRLKRIHLADALVFDAGGEYRLRQHNETTILRRDNFLLERLRVYGDLHYDDWFRAYAEAIDASSWWQRTTPKSSDINRWDALDLFGDAKFFDDGDGQAWVRGGRQQLYYGNQRTIGGRDWPNAMLAYDGFKTFWRSGDWDLDAFWLRPVPTSQHVPSDSVQDFDHPDPHQEFYGLYATRKNTPEQTWDYYYLRYGNYNMPTPFANHTFGLRWLGQYEHWLWEFEGAFQFGDVGPRSQSGGFYTVGGGRKLVALPWEPELWIYYDWASGDRNPYDQHVGTYNQLFPTGHRWFGYMDLVGRQNIEDCSCQFNLRPHKKLDFQTWYHVFHLQQARDALYSASGTIVRQDKTGASGTDVGQEVDLVLRWKHSANLAVAFGYCHFFPGHFLSVTPGGGPQQDFYYTQCTTKF